MALTFITNLSIYLFIPVFLETLFTTLLSLLKSGGTGFSLFIFILSTSAFKPAKSDFAAKLDV